MKADSIDLYLKGTSRGKIGCSRASVIQSSMFKTFQVKARAQKQRLLIPVMRRERQRPGLHIKLQDIQDYVERPCLKETIETMAKIQVRFKKGGCYISGLQKILPTPFSSGARS